MKKEVTRYYREVEICKDCGGTGKVKSYDKFDITHTQEAKYETCPTCQGMRTVYVTKTTIIEVYPYSDASFLAASEFKTKKP